LIAKKLTISSQPCAYRSNISQKFINV